MQFPINGFQNQYEQNIEELIIYFDILQQLAKQI